MIASCIIIRYVSKGTISMSGYIPNLLLLALVVIFWQARARTFNQLLDASNHHQVLAAIINHPKGGSWSEHKRWMADRE